MLTGPTKTLPLSRISLLTTTKTSLLKAKSRNRILQISTMLLSQHLLCSPNLCLQIEILPRVNSDLDLQKKMSTKTMIGPHLKTMFGGGQAQPPRPQFIQEQDDDDDDDEGAYNMNSFRDPGSLFGSTSYFGMTRKYEDKKEGHF